VVKRTLLAAATVATVLGGSSLAMAKDPERAAELFRQGREAMASHNVELACRRFAESESEDPREGTLINLARCEEALGKLAAARQYWQQAADLAQGMGDPRADYALSELARIDGRVPRLTVRLEGDAPVDTMVRRDGVDFGGASLGVELPVEVGTHSVRVVAPGREPRDYVVELREGEQRVLSVSPGALLLLPPGSPGGSEGAAESSALPSPTLRGLAYGLGGVGIAAVAVGAGFGVAALNDASAAAGHCQGDVCDAPGTRARNDEESAASVATVGLLSGAALLAAGATVRILTPSPDERPLVRRRLAYLVGGIGLAATSVGLVFGARAYEQERESAAGCDGNQCDHQGAAARRDAISAGNVSTAAVVGGGAFLAGGVALWLTARPRSGGTVGFGVGGTPGTGASLRIDGSW
jgi:hypothetical protein